MLPRDIGGLGGCGCFGAISRLLLIAQACSAPISSWAWPSRRRLGVAHVVAKKHSRPADGRPWLAHGSPGPLPTYSGCLFSVVCGRLPWPGPHLILACTQGLDRHCLLLPPWGARLWGGGVSGSRVHPGTEPRYVC